VSKPYKNKQGKLSVDCKCDCGTVKMVEVTKINTNRLGRFCRKCFLEKIATTPEEKKRYKAKYFQENKDKIRDKRRQNPVPIQTSRYYNYKNKYGITKEEYKELLKKYDYKCGICGSNENLCIDHNHTSGEIRGILCKKCNSAIGLFQDDINNLTTAIQYLKGDCK
jgi:hypothetical protein